MNDRGAGARGAELFRDTLVWDMVFPLEPWCGNGWDKLERFRAAGFDLVSLTLAGDNHNIGEGIQRVAAARAHVLSQPDRYVLIHKADDVEAARRGGRLAVAFHLEGTRCFERNLDMVDAYYALGVRHTLLAFNQANDAGGGCAERSDGGLTAFGAALVRRMEAAGMLLDLSHTGRRTSLEALALATKPCVFSHSMADAVHPHFRNLTDEQIDACARTGGVIGMSGSGEYLGDLACSNDAILRHIDHIAQRVGPRHVGLGLDFVFDAEALNAWARGRPQEWPQTRDPAWPGFRYAVPEQVPELAGLLLQHGYGEPEVRGILGGNWLRVCREVWK